MPACFSDLGDDLIEAILRRVDVPERHRYELVCVQWRRVLSFLLTSLTLGQAGINRVNSLAAWLLRHNAGANLRQLELHLAHVEEGEDDSLGAATASLRAACAAGLAQLLVTADQLDIGEWVGGMSQLRRLDMFAPDVTAAADMRHLALDDLRLRAERLDIQELHLPTSLTQLVVSLSADQLNIAEVVERSALATCLPQMSTLTRLHTLRLDIACINEDSYDVLAALSSLQRLQLLGRCQVPPCLADLTGLTHLAIDDRANLEMNPDETSAAVVEDALPYLERLQHLALSAASDMPAPPQALTRLTALTSFHWLAEPEWYGLDEAYDDEPVALPAGAWLGCLRRLASPLPMLDNSAATLVAAATQLTYLGASLRNIPGPAPQLSALEPLVQLPSLRQLAVALDHNVGRAQLEAFTAAAAVQNPALSVMSTNDVFDEPAE